MAPAGDAAEVSTEVEEEVEVQDGVGLAVVAVEALAEAEAQVEELSSTPEPLADIINLMSGEHSPRSKGIKPERLGPCINNSNKLELLLQPPHPKPTMRPWPTTLLLA